MSSLIENMTRQTAKWLSGEGQDNDIVISSRVRLARNLHAYPFGDRASDEQQQNVLSTILKAAKNSKSLKDANHFDMFALDELDRQVFVERWLISTDFAEMKNPRVLLVTQDEDIGLMINEEDHLRLQVIGSGLSLEQSWIAISRLHEELSQELTFAFSERFGYLTACPSNVGTGIRFSVFVHLPGLTFTKKIEEAFAKIVPAGVTVRGFYGEGSKLIGNFFQVSNQYTLGWTEQGILDRITPLIERFIGEEREARHNIMNDTRIVVEDKIYRTLAILSKARLLSFIEFLELLSTLRLGVELGIVEEISKKVFNELMVMTQPAHIQKCEGKTLGELERDALRANLVRETLHLN